MADNDEVANSYLANLVNLFVRTTKRLSSGALWSTQHFRLDIGADGTAESMVTTANPLPIAASSGYSTINNGTKSVTTAGTAETLVAATTACKKVDIMALDTNTGKVWIGGSTIDKTAKNGKYIFAAQSYTIEIDDLVKIYLDVDTNGEGVVFTYYN